MKDLEPDRSLITLGITEVESIPEGINVEVMVDPNLRNMASKALYQLTSNFPQVQTYKIGNNYFQEKTREGRNPTERQNNDIKFHSPWLYLGGFSPTPDGLRFGFLNDRAVIINHNDAFTTNGDAWVDSLNFLASEQPLKLKERLEEIVTNSRINHLELTKVFHLMVTQGAEDLLNAYLGRKKELVRLLDALN